MSKQSSSAGRNRRARDVMHTTLLTVSVSTPLSEVERLLGEHRVGGVPVSNETGHLVGVVSMRDLIEHYAGEPDGRAGLAPGFYGETLDRAGEDDEDMTTFGGFVGDSATASDIMTGEVYAVDADTTLQDVAREMLRLKIHRILVMDQGKHVGLISTFDLLEVFAG
ncbi:MAG: CBS domain-containing protein [Planctomycetota bacterium]|jgi:CBS domain-containing protein